jgi:hypothetical protein
LIHAISFHFTQRITPNAIPANAVALSEVISDRIFFLSPGVISRSEYAASAANAAKVPIARNFMIISFQRDVSLTKAGEFSTPNSLGCIMPITFIIGNLREEVIAKRRAGRAYFSHLAGIVQA